MKQRLIKGLVRVRFALTRRRQASEGIRKALECYLELGRSMGPEEGRRQVRVPPMLGVDEDMREWSFYMILEHNAIVNGIITVIVESLVRGEEPASLAGVDPKKDVMPSPDAGEEQVEAFRHSVEAHLERVSRLPSLRGAATRRHPVFGELNAHGWHCMFGLHLELHLKQARVVLAECGGGEGNHPPA